jgi:hypothetical protein
MSKGRARTRLWLYVLIAGTVAQFTACQVSPGQTAGTAASWQALADTVQTFILDFARGLFAAAVL